MIHLSDMILSSITALLLFTSPEPDVGRQDPASSRPVETAGSLYRFRQLAVIPDNFKVRASDLLDIDAGSSLVGLKDGRVIRLDGTSDEPVPKLLPRGQLAISKAGRQDPDPRLGGESYTYMGKKCSFVDISAPYVTHPHKVLAVYDCSQGKSLNSVIVEVSAEGVRFPEPLASFEGRPVMMSVGVSPHPWLFAPILVVTENSAGQLALLAGTWLMRKDL